MPRGAASEIGAERIAQNGYRYIKTEGGWKLFHHLIAEQNIGRNLTANEYACFADGDRTNFEPKNIIVQLRGRASIQRRLAQVNARLDELAAVKEDLERRLKLQEKLA